jgi:lipid A 4'-phosphatase
MTEAGSSNSSPDRINFVTQPSDMHNTELSASASKMAGWKLLAIQFALLLLTTIMFTWLDVDRTISGYFYTPEQGWFLARQPLWHWLYRYGTIPGIVFTLATLLVWLASFFTPRLQDWRRPCLVVILTTVLAAGFLVNSVLKQYWGRPRPSQTVTYGGNWDYRPIFPPGTPGKGASFPCGHCTMGFVFLAAAGFHRRSKLLSIGGVTTGLALGTLLSAARVVQGAHFTSDAVWALGVVGMTATALMFYLPQTGTTGQRAARPARSARRKLLLMTAGLLAIALVAGGFLTRRPFYRTYTYPFDLTPEISRIELAINADPETFKVEYLDNQPAELQVDAHGFGWINFVYQLRFSSQPAGDTLRLELQHATGSYFAELDHALALTLPETVRDRLEVKLVPFQGN